MTNPPTPECREEFEAWARAENLPLEMGHFGDYSWHDVRSAWKGWKACWSRPVAAIDTAEAVKRAIQNYHFALDSREHGGVAQSHALSAIMDALDLHWVQGAEKARRAAPLPSGPTRETT